jgi:2-phosphoglycerate kinase
MIIWINGPFGIGKTQTAYELNRRVHDSIVYDPEQIGYFIRKIIPRPISTSDFQDYTFWRSFNKEILNYLDKNNSVVIVPMTLVNPTYYDEIILPLKNDHIVHHFTLMALKSTIEQRLKRRFDGNSWNIRQIDRCLTGLSDSRFKEYINTDKMDLYSVVEYIGQSCKLALSEDKRTKIKKSFDRLFTTIRHIR